MLILKEFIFEMLMMSLEVYRWILIVYVIAGYFVTNRYASWYVFLQELSEPSINFVRRITMNRLTIDRMDFSPVVVFFGIILVQLGLRQIFYAF